MDIVKLVKTAYLSMSNLIDKDAVVAEIKRISCENPMDNSWYVDTEELLDFLDTLEVKGVAEPVARKSKSSSTASHVASPT